MTINIGSKDRILPLLATTGVIVAMVDSPRTITPSKSSKHSQDSNRSSHTGAATSKEVQLNREQVQRLWRIGNIVPCPWRQI